jgi:hypothetical protein
MNAYCHWSWQLALYIYVFYTYIYIITKFFMILMAFSEIYMHLDEKCNNTYIHNKVHLVLKIIRSQIAAIVWCIEVLIFCQFQLWLTECFKSICLKNIVLFCIMVGWFLETIVDWTDVHGVYYEVYFLWLTTVWQAETHLLVKLKESAVIPADDQ